jgi:alkylhydroperoxidase/carboxymuconolactone decarboxylase family protein YurZ
VKSKTRASTTAKELPSSARHVASSYPEIWRSFEGLGSAVGESGPLSDREQRLVKLAYSIASSSEGATHSHVRRGLKEGLGQKDLYHVALLAITTVGWPVAVKGLTWINDLAPSDGGKATQQRKSKSRRPLE